MILWEKGGNPRKENFRDKGQKDAVDHKKVVKFKAHEEKVKTDEKCCVLHATACTPADVRLPKCTGKRHIKEISLSLSLMDFSTKA